MPVSSRNAVNRALAMLLASFLSAASAAQQLPETVTPFGDYDQVADKVYVFDRSLFAPYKGPDVSRVKFKYEDGSGPPGDNRERLGIITLAPGTRIYVDVMSDPLDEYYEMRDVKTGKIVFKLHVHDVLDGALLFNG